MTPLLLGPVQFCQRPTYTPSHLRQLVLGLLTTCLSILSGLNAACAQSNTSELPYCIFPEQRTIQHREAESLSHMAVTTGERPPTVSDQVADESGWRLSLDDAIQLALQNAEVVRVLGGFSAGSTGRTIYDPAITNTQVDQARATFDPNINLGNNFFRSETPGAGLLNPADPLSDVVIRGFAVESYQFDLGLAQKKTTGGTARLNVAANQDRPGSFLDPSANSAVDIGFTQPLLQGRGQAVNLAPIVIARLDTERSFFN